MMIARTRTFRRLAAAFAVVFGMASLPVGPAAAEMISTDGVVAQAEAQDARETVKTFLARDDVVTELEAMGVAPAEAQARVAALSDAEAVDLAERIDDAPAGQAVGAIIGAALIIFLVLLITDILGFTSVFDFTRKGSANPA